MVIPTAVVVAIGAIIAAALALIGVLLGHQAARIATLERRVDRAWGYNRRLWQWAQTAIRLYQLHRGVDSPDLPPVPTEDDDE